MIKKFDAPSKRRWDSSKELLFDKFIIIYADRL